MATRIKATPRLLIAACLCFVGASGCAETTRDASGREQRDYTVQQQDTTPASTGQQEAKRAIDTVAASDLPQVTYHRAPVPGRSGLDSLREAVGGDYLSTVLKLNRKDTRHIARNDTLIVPDTLMEFMAYSPFPPRLPFLDSIPKLIVVNQRIQAIAAYERSNLVRWAPVSTGKESTPTDNGLYHTNWKSRKRRSTVNNDWIMEWYWNLGNFSGVSMHQYDLPGYPASHACVRLPEDDARWFYDWAESWRLHDGRIAAHGTPVVLYGEYPFDGIAPWKLLPEHPDTTQVYVRELRSVLEEYLPTIREEQRQREQWLSRQQQEPSPAQTPAPGDSLRSQRANISARSSGPASFQTPAGRSPSGSAPMAVRISRRVG